MKPEDLAAKAALALQPLTARFARQKAIVFASGPSLTKLWSADREPPCPAVAVNDAWRVVPTADVLYATDDRWWLHHKLVPEFKGVKVGWGGESRPDGIVWLADGGTEGFDPRLGWIRHCRNSGGAAIHLAAQLGARTILLVGFDQRRVGDKDHFFGAHPDAIELHRGMGSPYPDWKPHFDALAAALAEQRIRVLNCTPGSALSMFPMANLEEMLPCLTIG